MAIVPFRRALIPYRFFHASYYIIGINTVVFLLGMLVPETFDVLALTWPGLSIEHSWWQLLTWFFAEPFNIGHLFNLAFNMLALVFFGDKVEREMGSFHFLILYMAIGLASGLLAMLVFGLIGMSIWPIFGATAMVFAVLTVYATLYPDAVIHLMGIIPLRAPVLLVVFAGIEVLFMLFSYGPIYLVHLVGLGLAWLFVRVRYHANPFRHLFR